MLNHSMMASGVRRRSKSAVGAKRVHVNVLSYECGATIHVSSCHNEAAAYGQQEAIAYLIRQSYEHKRVTRPDVEMIWVQ